MGKKILAKFLCFVMIVGLMNGLHFNVAKADTKTGTCGDNLTWTYDSESGKLTISGTGKMKDYSSFNFSLRPWHYYSNSIKNIEISNGVTSIGSYAFYGCSSLTSIDIPDSITSICSEAFYGCSSLTSIDIPDSVTNISSYTFHGCSSLTSITVSEGNSVYDSRDNSNAIIKTSTNTLILGCANTIIPDSVTSIGDNAFYDCSSLTSIDIPNSVTNIGSCAFYGCNSLISIDIPDSVTSIGYTLFGGCSSLTSITVSEGNSVYDSRDNSNAIIKTSTNTLITGCANTIIPDSVTSIGSYAFEDCSSLTSIDIPDSVTSIGYGAFYGCTSLTSIDIPDSVTSIGYCAFYGCSSLTSIDIPNSVTSIDYKAFYDCSSLTSIDIPNSVTNIEKEAFYGCSSLTSIDIPNSVTSIGDDAFYGCSSLTSIVIPEGVTSIGNYAFSDCSSLISIVIPDSVTSIGSNAFSDCESLGSLYIKSATLNISSLNLPANTTVYCPEDSASYWNCKNNGWKCVTYSDKISIDDFTYQIEEGPFYASGTGIKPKVKLFDANNNELVEDTDFSVKYSNNVNVGAGIICITGIGNYTGSIYAGFVISEEPTTEEQTTQNTSESTTEEETTLKTISGYLPMGITITAVDADNVNVEWITDQRAIYYKIYINDQLDGVSVSGLYKIPSSKLKPGSTYIIGIQAISETEETSIVNIKYQMIEPATTKVQDDKTCSHSYGKWKTITAPTVFKTGSKVRTCSLCGESQKTSIAKLKPTIKLSATKKTIKANKSFNIKVSKLAKGDSVKSVKSSANKIAKVKKVSANKYKITGLKFGKAKLVVTLKSNKKAICTVTVK